MQLFSAEKLRSHSAFGLRLYLKCLAHHSRNLSLDAKFGTNPWVIRILLNAQVKEVIRFRDSFTMLSALKYELEDRERCLLRISLDRQISSWSGASSQR